MNYKDLPIHERPAYRASYQTNACSTIELLAALIGGPTQLEAAEALVTRYGDLRTISQAPVEELGEVEHVGQAKAAGIKAALELARRLQNQDRNERPTITSPADIAELMMSRMQNLEQEHLFVLLLNTRNQVIGDPIEVYKGSVNTSLIRISEILRPAIRANAVTMIVLHNHPSGDPSPSPEDVALTRALVQAGHLVDIELLDHVIIGQGNQWTSLKSKGLGF